MKYIVVIEDNALCDIQEAIDYYDDQQIGLGKKFENNVHKSIVTLTKLPFFIQASPLKWSKR